ADRRLPHPEGRAGGQRLQRPFAGRDVVAGHRRDDRGASDGVPDMTEADRRYPIEQLTEFCVRVFMHFGIPEADARRAAEVLAAADLRGIDSHGVARMHAYFDMLTLGD